MQISQLHWNSDWDKRVYELCTHIKSNHITTMTMPLLLHAIFIYCQLYGIFEQNTSGNYFFFFFGNIYFAIFVNNCNFTFFRDDDVNDSSFWRDSFKLIWKKKCIFIYTSVYKSIQTNNDIFFLQIEKMSCYFDVIFSFNKICFQR